MKILQKRDSLMASKRLDPFCVASSNFLLFLHQPATVVAAASIGPPKPMAVALFCAATAALAMAVRAALAWANLSFSSSASCWRLDLARRFWKNLNYLFVKILYTV